MLATIKFYCLYNFTWKKKKVTPSSIVRNVKCNYREQQCFLFFCIKLQVVYFCSKVEHLNTGIKRDFVNIDHIWNCACFWMHVSLLAELHCQLFQLQKDWSAFSRSPEYAFPIHTLQVWTSNYSSSNSDYLRNKPSFLTDTLDMFPSTRCRNESQPITW